MLAEEIPPYLQTYLDKVNDLQIFGDAKANHILLNEYKPGKLNFFIKILSNLFNVYC